MITISKELNATIERETRVNVQTNVELKIGGLVVNLKLKGQLSLGGSPPQLEDHDRCQDNRNSPRAHPAPVLG
jgi:hypothetical protein